MADDVMDRFTPTSGRVTGVLALLVVAAVLAIAVVDPDNAFPAPVTAAAAVVGVLVWAAMLRPRVWVTERSLVLRGMLDTVSLPLASIEEVSVRQVLAVRAGHKRYVSAAVGRSLRQVVRSRSGSAPASPEPPGQVSYPDFVEERIRQLGEDARARAGIERYSDEQVALAADVRRAPAWPEIVALVLSVTAFVVTLLL